MAALAALGFGCGDFLGGSATRSIPAGRTLLWAHGIGFALMLGWAGFTPTTPIPADLGAGAVAGVFGMVGLVFLYTGLARGRAAVVAPTTAVVGAVIPVVAGLAMGERLHFAAWMGIALALPAVALASSAVGVERRQAGFRYGVAAGALFGGYFVALAFTSEGSELWPLVASRGVSTTLLVGFALVNARAWLRAPEGKVLAAVVGVGVLDLAGNVLFLLATKLGSLVVVAVVASLYPAVTVIASRFAYAEHLSWRQGGGLVLALLSIALLSIA